MIEIDGSMGEGGGQILRSALGLSMVTGKPFRVEKIRANREKPGLMRQHLTAVNAAAAVCGATVDGAAIGASELTFTPAKVKPGEYHFATGSAGSTTLVLQTILPALLAAREPSTVTLEGGTHNPYAPPLDFLTKSFLPLVNRLGPNVTITPDRFGFYPTGGGRFTVRIEPPKKWSTITLDDRGRTIQRCCEVVIAKLPRLIADRELAVVRAGTGWDDEDCYTILELPEDQGPGNVVMIDVVHEHVTNVFTGFGVRGVRAEAVADGVTEEAVKFIAADVPVGEHLADQLMIPFAVAGGGSFVTMPLTPHATTNMEVIQMFLDLPIAAQELAPTRWGVTVGSSASS